MGLFQLPFSGEELVEKYRKLDSMPQLGAEETVEDKGAGNFSPIQFLNTYVTFPPTRAGSLVIGETYEVVIGSRTYDVIATNNTSYGVTLETEDFIFHQGLKSGDNFMILAKNAKLLGASGIVIRLRTSIVVPIEDKYIPDTVVRKTELEESVKNYVDEAILGGEW